MFDNEDKDDIIKQQAQHIDDLQSELVQVYDELHRKQKRDRKRKSDMDVAGEKRERAAQADETPFGFLRLIGWFVFAPESIVTYAKRTRRAVEARELWRLTGFLTYAPLLVGILGFLLGSTPVPVAFPIRVALCVGFLPLVYLGWLRTVEIDADHHKARAWFAALFTSVVYALMVTLSGLKIDRPSEFHWGMLFVAFVLIANAGLVEGIRRKLDHAPRKGVYFEYTTGMYLAAAAILLAAAFSAPSSAHSLMPVHASVILCWPSYSLGRSCRRWWYSGWGLCRSYSRWSSFGT